MEEDCSESFSESDRPSEVEKLQVKCLRLENKVKTLKDVSSIRKNLLELRERESKDLIKRLEAFEVMISDEKETRAQLSARMLAADSEYQALSDKLAENVLAFNQAKHLYEKRIRSLVIQLDESADALSKAVTQKDAQHQILQKVLADTEFFRFQMDSKFRDAQAQKEDELKMIEEKNLETQNELKSALEMALEENIRLRLQIAENIIEENLLTDESLSKSEAHDQFSSVQMTPTLEKFCSEQSGVNCSEQGDLEIGNNSMVVDIAEFSDKLDESEDAEIVYVPGHDDNCYISVVDSDGGESKLVLSATRTFMKLKDLILEKKSLQYEIHGLKKLGKKLEAKVDRQSHRLYLISLEVNKTWRLVSKLRAQCGQLHTSKSVQRYELQEKRRFIEKLKIELGASREKWMKLREKNMASQIEWESIRDEFARRRAEVCQSRESAFFEDSTTSSLDGDHPEVTSSLDGDHAATTLDSTSSEDVSSGQSKVEPESEASFVLDDDATTDLTSDLENTETDPEERLVELMEGAANFSYEELINRRARRLLELEEECRLLFSKLKVSKVRNTELASKLANLHNHYGSEGTENPSEDSALEGDENGLLLSEASGGDTAYSSHGEDTVFPQRDDDAEMHFEGEIEGSGGEGDQNPISMREASEVEQRFNEQHDDEVMPSDRSGETLNCHEGSDGHANLATTVGTEPPTGGNAAAAQMLDAGECAGSEEGDGPLTSIVFQAQTNYASDPDLPTAALEQLGGDDGEGSSSKYTVHSLSRIIIQQLPKYLVVLKRENCNLKRGVAEAAAVMKAKESELEAQKSQVRSSIHTEMELRSELDLKQRLIRELTTKIQIATENYHAINEEHEQMSEYIQMKLQDTKIQEQRKVVKMRNLKHCTKCTKKFSLFKRKVHCSTCGYSFCTDCLSQQDLLSPIERESRKKVLICSTCDERKRKLDAVVQQHFKNLRM